MLLARFPISRSWKNQSNLRSSSSVNVLANSDNNVLVK